MNRKRKPLPGDVLLASFVPGAIALGMVLFSMCGCDPSGQPPPAFADSDEDEPADRAELESVGAAAGPSFAAPSECDGACNLDHCTNVDRVRLDLEDAGHECEAECMRVQVECLVAAAEDYGWCGECEHDAAECRSECAP